MPTLDAVPEPVDAAGCHTVVAAVVPKFHAEMGVPLIIIRFSMGSRTAFEAEIKRDLVDFFCLETTRIPDLREKLDSVDTMRNHFPQIELKNAFRHIQPAGEPNPSATKQFTHDKTNSEVL
jgi:hypothetical protein